MRKNRFQAIWIVIAAALVLVLAFLTGCSATKQIGNAAVSIQQKSQAASVSLASAVATKEIGPKALPHIEAAKTAIDEINTEAIEIVEVVNSGAIKDADSPFWKFIKSIGFLATLITVAVLSVFYAPIIKPIIQWVGALIGWIPKPIKAQAKADAAFIAEQSPIDNTDLPRIQAIEANKTDPRYKAALDKQLTEKGIPT